MSTTDERAAHGARFRASERMCLNGEEGQEVEVTGFNDFLVITHVLYVSFISKWLLPPIAKVIKGAFCSCQQILVHGEEDNVSDQMQPMWSNPETIRTILYNLWPTSHRSKNHTCH